MNAVTVYASNMEKKLIEEFKEKFREKLGYMPLVTTRVVLSSEYSIPIMELSQLEMFFEPFLVRHNNRKIHLFAKKQKACCGGTPYDVLLHSPADDVHLY